MFGYLSSLKCVLVTELFYVLRLVSKKIIDADQQKPEVCGSTTSTDFVKKQKFSIIVICSICLIAELQICQFKYQFKFLGGYEGKKLNLKFSRISLNVGIFQKFK